MKATHTPYYQYHSLTWTTTRTSHSRSRLSM